jgi:hypothetical protein
MAFRRAYTGVVMVAVAIEFDRTQYQNILESRVD